MAVPPRIISLVRLGVFGALILFAIIVLGVGAHLASIFSQFDVGIPEEFGMSIAVAILTLVAVVPVLVIDFIRKGAVTGMVAVELGWTFLLWILWLANAGLAADRFRFGCFFVTFDDFGVETADTGPCSELHALLAFSWLSWVLVSTWFTFLLVVSILSFTRGNAKVWTSSVQETDFFAYKSNPGLGQQQPVYNQTYGGMQQQYTGTTMQPQYSGPPQPQYGVPQQVTYPPQGAGQV